MKILKPGLYTTIQDCGRHNVSHLGIPISGAMDAQSANLANILLGNDKTDSILECTIIGPSVQFSQSTNIAITGANVDIFLNDIKVKGNEIINIQTEDILHFGKLSSGCRFYIAIDGGFQSEKIAESRSVCITSQILGLLKKGDSISYPKSKRKSSVSIIPKKTISSTLEVYEGAEYAILGQQSKEFFLQKYIILPLSNRMAYRVDHNIQYTHNHTILSSGTLPGTVQLTPSGEMIFLMRDAQTTGGYPRIFQLTEESICRLSQLNAGGSFQLKKVDY